SEKGDRNMAGHSKWHNIQRRKGAQDAKRGKIFMRHAKLIYTAAKMGGGDPEMNPSLRTAIEKAKADNMPNDNIDRAVKKATGMLDGANFEEVTYEGYGTNGTAVIVHALTDNRKHKTEEVRQATSKKVKEDNIQNDNIDRAVKKATGMLDGANFEEVTYEGYGPNGTAVIVHALTDNRNRTASEVRHAFSKNGGNLGETGCVSFMFDRKGYIVIVDKEEKIDEDELTLEAIDAGADDIEVEEGVYEIYTTPDAFQEVNDHLREAGYDIEEAEITLIPQTYTALDGDAKEKMMQMIDMLEENEDVQDVHHNLEETE